MFPHLLRQAASSALDLLLPSQCLCCEGRVERQGLLCGECFRSTAFVTEPYCNRCGVPFAAASQAFAGQLCPACHATPPVFAQARAALRYDAQGRRLVLPLKHADRPELAAMLAPHMLRAGDALLRRADLLVPVPLHRWRLFHRRYNQAALLAAAVGRLAGLTVQPDELVRRRPTVSLGDLSAAERAAVVHDAFAVRPGRQALLPGRSVVLIDDVMTSGATANACAAVLLAGGACRVDVLVAARVPDPRLG
ncbi:MAG TPA: ComF family protein [Acetobacteraceae bacterium]|nr:ComF family protein [Acetobacteraceae bacterium]